MERYDKQFVILKTNEGLAHKKKNLIAIWKVRIKQYFPHYKLVGVNIYKNKGKIKY